MTGRRPRRDDAKPVRLPSEEEIVKAFVAYRDSIVHKDAMTEDELCKLRQWMGKPWLSLTWLRNKFVKVRKAACVTWWDEH